MAAAEVKGGQVPYSILMPLFFTELKNRDIVSGRYWLSDHCYIHESFPATGVLRKPIKLKQASFPNKSKRFWMSPFLFYFFFFCHLSAGTAKSSGSNFFLTVNSNDLKIRKRAAKTLKCRPLDFS